jgi:uncharacterized protein (TIGR00730 family)
VSQHNTPLEDDLERPVETTEAPSCLTRQEASPLHAAAIPLLSELDKVPDGDVVAEIITNALKLLRDQTNRGDMKLVNASLKEMRYALKIFAPYRDVRKCSIFGSARTPEAHPDYQSALELGKLLARDGWMVITGAGGGIMAAGHGGAGAGPSFGLAIRLPFEQKTNPFIEGDKKLINFKYFFTRKLMFVRSSHAVVAYPGGFGTMDEAFEVLTLIQTGKSVPAPVVLVDRPGGDYWVAWQKYVNDHLLGRALISEEDLDLYKITDNVEVALEEVTRFFRNYHSVRYTRDELAIRMHKAPSDEQLAEVQQRFGRICLKGGFRVSPALPVERDEPALGHLPRLVFAFNRREHGKLRQLINLMNSW